MEESTGQTIEEQLLEIAPMSRPYREPHLIDQGEFYVGVRGSRDHVYEVHCRRVGKGLPMGMWCECMHFKTRLARHLPTPAQPGRSRGRGSLRCKHLQVAELAERWWGVVDALISEGFEAGEVEVFWGLVNGGRFVEQVRDFEGIAREMIEVSRVAEEEEVRMAS